MKTVKIDAHHHVMKKTGYVEELLEHYDRIGISKVCLQELPASIRGFGQHRIIGDAVRKWPERVVGFAHLNLGAAKPEDVLRLKEEGFRGLKCILPPKPYHDESYFDLYAAAEELELILLFHLGIVARSLVRVRVDNNFMRPVYLDTIARMFPQLPMIGAHLGNPWYEEAAMVCRWNPNLFFDITGSTLKAKTPEFIGRLLWWGKAQEYYYTGNDPWEKIVFGTDVAYKDAEDVINDYDNLMAKLELADEKRDLVWGGTMSRLLAGERPKPFSKMS